MSLRDLPAVKAFTAPKGYNWDAPADVLAKWSPRAAESDEGATISIYDVIGMDYWSGEGFTAKRLAGALRAVGRKPVEVLINSPGGDMFEGVAIYNLLREHPEKVTVKVLGMAASAASVIAMAGDEVLIGAGAMLMIHNSWGLVVGNRHDMTAAAATFAEFDAAMSDIYQARTGLAADEIDRMMDEETWMRGADAIRLGFADATTDDPSPGDGQGQARADIAARRRIDTILAQQGVSRSERRRLLRDATGTRDAAGDQATPGAGPELQAALAGLLAEVRAAAR